MPKQSLRKVFEPHGEEGLRTDDEHQSNAILHTRIRRNPLPQNRVSRTIKLRRETNTAAKDAGLKPQVGPSCPRDTRDAPPITLTRNPCLQHLQKRREPSQPTMSLFARAKDLAFNPDHTRWLTPLLLVVDAALSGVIIEKIPCSSYLSFSLNPLPRGLDNNQKKTFRT